MTRGAPSAADDDRERRSAAALRQALYRDRRRAGIKYWPTEWSAEAREELIRRGLWDGETEPSAEELGAWLDEILGV